MVLNFKFLRTRRGVRPRSAHRQVWPWVVLAPGFAEPFPSRLRVPETERSWRSWSCSAWPLAPSPQALPSSPGFQSAFCTSRVELRLRSPFCLPWRGSLFPALCAGLHALVCSKGSPGLRVDGVLSCRTRSWAAGRGGGPGSVHGVGSRRPALAPTQFTSFFGALDSVLRYRAAVLQAFRDMNRFTVNETVLSTRDALVLLHQWSLVERDVRLQEDLRAAAERCQVGELLSECRTRPPSCARCPAEQPASYRP